MKKSIHALDLSAEYAKHYSPLLPPNDLLNVALSAALLLANKFAVTLTIGGKEHQYNDVCWVPELRRLSLRMKEGTEGVRWVVITENTDIHQAILDQCEERRVARMAASREDAEERDYYNVWAKA